MEEKQSTYLYLRQQVLDGHRVVFNFAEKSIRIDGKLFSYKATKVEEDFCDAIDRLNELYYRYKHSVPGKNEPSRPYFKALKYDELSADDVLFGEQRSLARFELEYYILMLYYAGLFSGMTWFWRSDKDKDFVILRGWFEEV